MQEQGAMTKTVTTTEAKAKLSALLGWVREHRDAVIVENRGEPSAVILPYPHYEELQRLREQQRRRDALVQLRRLRDKVSERNQDLTQEQVEAIAEEVSRDVVQGLIDKGKVRFERG